MHVLDACLHVLLLHSCTPLQYIFLVADGEPNDVVVWREGHPQEVRELKLELAASARLEHAHKKMSMC